MTPHSYKTPPRKSARSGRLPVSSPRRVRGASISARKSSLARSIWPTALRSRL